MLQAYFPDSSIVDLASRNGLNVHLLGKFLSPEHDLEQAPLEIQFLLQDINGDDRRLLPHLHIVGCRVIRHQYLAQSLSAGLDLFDHVLCKDQQLLSCHKFSVLVIDSSATNC